MRRGWTARPLRCHDHGCAIAHATDGIQEGSESRASAGGFLNNSGRRFTVSSGVDMALTACAGLWRLRRLDMLFIHHNFEVRRCIAPWIGSRTIMHKRSSFLRIMLSIMASANRHTLAWGLLVRFRTIVILLQQRPCVGRRRHRRIHVRMIHRAHGGFIFFHDNCCCHRYVFHVCRTTKNDEFLIPRLFHVSWKRCGRYL